jgi:large subunit ribosomal protein L16
MFLQPKKLKKLKKTRKGIIRNLEFKSNTLKFGIIGMKAATSGIITARQIEAARQAIARKTKRKGKIWIRVFPDLPVTSKPREARMGKGKGPISFWAARVRGGTVLFEICGIKENIASDALRLGGNKLPIKTAVFN